jgi:hypothetical protein
LLLLAVMLLWPENRVWAFAPAPHLASAETSHATPSSIRENVPLAADPASGCCVAAESAAPLGTTTAYRAVSQAEYDSALSTGQFSQGPNSLEGKWFADTYEGSILHGDGLQGPGNYNILEADLPNDAPSLFKVPNLDGRGPATYIHLDDLQGVTPRPYSGGQ